MARTKDDPSLKSRSSREKLSQRTEPYWLVMEKGRALGYRKGKKGGNWIARYYDPSATSTRTYQALGAADDVSDADGKMTLSFAQAQEAAREWFKIAYHQATGDRVTIGDYTVKDAIEDYLADRARHGAKTALRMRGDLDAWVIPSLGSTAVAKLTKKRIEDWLEGVAAAPARHRGKPGKTPESPEELRARRESANRVWKNFKAALNLALRDKKVQTDHGWKGVEAFRGTKVARIRFLSIQDQQRLVNAAPATDFRRLLQAGLFTGAREGELARLQARDFDPLSGTLFIETSKSGKARHIALTMEALEFFKEATAGLSPESVIFPRNTYDRKQKKALGTWSRAELSRMMRSTCTDAGIEPLVFHELRHTCASSWINAGIPLVFVAQQLGHRDTRMVEEHYGHLCQTAKMEAIRRLAPALGIHQPSGIQALEIKNA